MPWPSIWRQPQLREACEISFSQFKTSCLRVLHARTSRGKDQLTQPWSGLPEISSSTKRSSISTSLTISRRFLISFKGWLKLTDALRTGRQTPLLAEPGVAQLDKGRKRRFIAYPVEYHERDARGKSTHAIFYHITQLWSAAGGLTGRHCRSSGGTVADAHGMQRIAVAQTVSQSTVCLNLRQYAPARGIGSHERVTVEQA